MSQAVLVAERPAPAVNVRGLFVGSCIALTSSAVMFAVLADILNPLKEQFLLSNEQVGWIAGAQWGSTAAIFLLGPLCDGLGMRRLMRFAAVVQIAGVLMMIFARGFWMLYFGVFLHALGIGTVEAVCNPLIATIYSDRKTQKLNQFHVWFPGGIVLGGLASFAMDKAGIGFWQLKLCLILVPSIVYGLMLWKMHFPATERVQAGVSFGQMVRHTLLRPLFLVLLLCMTLTASIELGPQRWIPSVLQAGGVPGILVLVWITGLMALLRQVSGPVVHRLKNTGVLLCSAILAGTGLLMLSYAHHLVVIGIAATVFALGVCYFWPTMLGTVAERVPNGGAMALALIGGTGMLFVSLVTTPVMGKIADHYVYKQLTSETQEQKTIEVLRQIDFSYRGWARSLGDAPHDQMIKADIDRTLANVEQVLQDWQVRGVFPAAGSANALRAAIKSGPPETPNPRDSSEARALEAKQKAEGILNPAENAGGLMSFRYVAPLSLILIVVFGVMYVQDRATRTVLSVRLPPHGDARS